MSCCYSINQFKRRRVSLKRSSLFKMITLIICLSLAVPVSMGIAAIQEERETVDIYYGTPMIDDDVDEIWNKAQWVDISTSMLDSYGADGSFKALWDEDYIYMLITVNDPVLNDKNKDPWNQDSVEIFIDENNNKTPYYEEDDAQIRVNYKNKQSGNKYGGVRSSTTELDDGYMVEAAIPLKTIIGKIGTTIGAEVAIMDADESGKRTSMMTWTTTTNTAHNDTSTYANLKFVSEEGIADSVGMQEIEVDWDRPYIEVEEVIFEDNFDTLDSQRSELTKNATFQVYDDAPSEGHLLKKWIYPVPYIEDGDWTQGFWVVLEGKTHMIQAGRSANSRILANVPVPEDAKKYEIEFKQYAADNDEITYIVGANRKGMGTSFGYQRQIPGTDTTIAHAYYSGAIGEGVKPSMAKINEWAQHKIVVNRNVVSWYMDETLMTWGIVEDIIPGGYFAIKHEYDRNTMYDDVKITVYEKYVESLETHPDAKVADRADELPEMEEESVDNHAPTQYAVYGTPQIDGHIDEIWENALSFDTNTQVIGTGGATGTIRTMWDENHLYVLAEIKDAVLSAESEYPWEQDNIEIFMDENNGKTPYYEEEDAQYRINYLNERSGTHNEGMVSEVTQTDTGYIVETAIPFKTMKSELNTSIGFEVAISDDPGTDSRETIRTWLTPNNNAWKDTSTYGNIKLITGKIHEVIKGTPIMDGETDEIWMHARQFSIDNNVKGNKGASGLGKILYDNNYLYLLVEVYDDVLSAQHKEPWGQDSIEIFMDENNAKTLYYEEDDQQYRVNYLNQVSGSNTEGFITETKLIENGYIVEAAIPLKALKQWGDTIGFDLAINDDPGTGLRESMMTWNTSNNDGWKDTSVFGNLLLLDNTISLKIDDSAIYVNGNKKNVGTKPLIRNQRTLIPIKTLINEIGGTVKEEGITTIIEALDTTIEIIAGSTTVLVNGFEHQIDVEPVISSGITYLPLRFVMESLGFEVEWKGDNQTILIKY